MKRFICLKKYAKLYIVLAFSLILITLLLINFFVIHPLMKRKNTPILLKNRTNYLILDEKEIEKQNPISLSKNALLIFWASWCSTCLDEADALNQFILQNPDIPVIIVSHDKQKETLEKYLTHNQYHWFVIYDTEKKIRERIDPESRGIPASYLLTKDGKILSKSDSVMSYEDLINFYYQKGGNGDSHK